MPGAPRSVRSYRTRHGRMGPQLQGIWQQDAVRFAMSAGVWALPPRTVLEIGSGMGDSLVAAATGFDLAIGVDVHVKGLAATARAALAAGRTNVRLVPGDAVVVLSDQVPSAALAELHVWFPDPWPKARHHKRRLIQPGVALLMAARLRPGGVLRLATDAPDYASAMIDVLGSTAGLRPLGDRGVVQRPEWRPLTGYERRALADGRTPTDIAFARLA